MAARKQAFERPDGRAQDELRKITIMRDAAPAAKGSVLLSMGATQVICAASVEESVPHWMRVQKIPGGWVTAEYSLLPYSTAGRTRREVTFGKPGGRTQEIQRMIGRSLRASVDMEALGQRTIWIDCDVLQADGGTRTASITGGFIALRLAINALLKEGLLKEDPIRERVAAVSVGLYNGKPVLDLNYTEDFAADVDMNLVMTSTGKFIEIQGTAENEPYSQTALNAMLRLGRKGITELLVMQEKVTCNGE
ncbi:MAG: ribonuclease PH [Spartobacteria bacterium]|nr:ribonuclease PH [Spartobacteria bacterium]